MLHEKPTLTIEQLDDIAQSAMDTYAMCGDTADDTMWKGLLANLASAAHMVRQLVQSYEVNERLNQEHHKVGTYYTSASVTYVTQSFG